MKMKLWIFVSLLMLASCGAWATYVISSRAFLRDYNSGVHSYLSGQFGQAEDSLKKALERRPRNAEVKQLFSKVLIDRSFTQYHQKDFDAALKTLDRAAASLPADDEAQNTFAALRKKLSVPEDERPVDIEHVLEGLYRHLPAKAQPASMEALMEKWLERSQMSQDVLLKRYWENQERWLVKLEREKDQFRSILYGGLVLFGICGVVLLVALGGLLHAYFGKRGVFSRLLEDHYRRVMAALPAGSHVLLGPPVSLHQVPESEQMDSIEAEIVSGQSVEEPARRLHTFLEGENPWVRARAAKILYRIDPKVSLEELKRLVADASSGSQVPGMWALSELGTSEALELLAPLAYSPSREIQEGAIRSLLQLQSKKTLATDTSLMLGKLLSEIRSRTGWVF